MTHDPPCALTRDWARLRVARRDELEEEADTFVHGHDRAWCARLPALSESAGSEVRQEAREIVPSRERRRSGASLPPNAGPRHVSSTPEPQVRQS